MIVKKTKKKKPLVFKAANIELIHTNGSYEFPHQLPDDSEFTTIPNVVPIEKTKYSCNVLLKGEWTYADWKGKRWFLKPGDYEASNTGEIWYAMVRDEWNEVINNCNFLEKGKKKKGARIKGILIKTNNRYLLNQWINTTKSPVNEPSNYLIINLKTKTEKFKIDISNLPIGLPWQKDYITQNLLNDFLNNSNISHLIPGRCDSWETWIIDYVDQIIRNKEKYYLTKLTKIQSSLSNSWTLSYDEDNLRLGDTKEEGFLIPEIDFSNLIAITPVSISDHRKKALPNTQAGLEVTKEQSVSKPKLVSSKEYAFPWDLVGKSVDDEFIKKIPRGTIIKNPSNEHELYQISYGTNNLLTITLINKMEEIERAWNSAIKDERKKAAIDSKLAKIDYILAYKIHKRKITTPIVIDWLNKKYPKWKIEKLNSSLPKKLDENGRESYDYEEIFRRFLKNEVEVEPKYGHLFCFEDERYPEEPWMWDPSSYGTINYVSWVSTLGAIGSAALIGAAAPYMLPIAAVGGAAGLAVHSSFLTYDLFYRTEISKYLITFRNWPGGSAYEAWDKSMYSVPLISEIIALKKIVFVEGTTSTENVKADSIMTSHYKSIGMLDDREYIYSEQDLKNWSHSLKKYVYWISKKEQLNQGTHLFRLEGTNPLVYLIIHNGKPGIIFDDKKIAKEKEYSVPIDSLEDSPLAYLDDKRKIHQKAFLNIFNKEYPLIEKLTEETKVNLSIKAISDPEKTISYETYLVNWKSSIQTILETIQVPKERKSMTDPIAGILLENNLIRQQRNDEDYRLMRERYALKVWQDDINASAAALKNAITFITSAAGAATTTFPKFFSPTGTSEYLSNWKPKKWMPTPGIDFMLEYPKYAYPDDFAHPFERDFPQHSRTIDKILSPSILGAGDPIRDLSQESRWTNFWNVFPNLAEPMNAAVDLGRYYFARETILENRKLTFYQLDEGHHRREWDLKREIDSLSLVHRSASFTDLEATRKFNESIGAEDIHIKVFYPSEEQMRIVDVYEREIGITLKADVALDVNEDIRGVWRFSEIDYISVEDPVTKNFLKAILLNGIRIVDRNEATGNYILTVQDRSIEERIRELEQKIFTCRAFLAENYTTAVKAVEVEVEERHKAKTKEIVDDLKIKLLTAENSLNECIYEKRELEKRPTQFQLEQTVKEETNKVWNQAIANSRITFRKNAKLQSEVAGLKQKLKECEEEKEVEKSEKLKLTNDLRQKTNELSQCKEELQEDKEKAQKQQNDLNEQIKKLQAERLLQNQAVNNIFAELAKGNKVTINKVSRQVSAIVTEDTLKEINKKIEEDNQKLLDAIKEKQDTEKIIETKEKELEKDRKDLEECKNQLSTTRRIIEEKERKILEGEKDKRDLEQCKKQLGITRGIIEEKQRKIIEQEKQIKVLRDAAGSKLTDLLTCLNTYKEEYKKLFDNTKEVGEFLTDILRYFYDSFAEIALFINPGLYNNQWYAIQYREAFLKSVGILYRVLQIHQKIFDKYPNLIKAMQTYFISGTGDKEYYAYILKNLKAQIKQPVTSERALIPFLFNEEAKKTWIPRLENAPSINVDGSIHEPYFWKHSKLSDNKEKYEKEYPLEERDWKTPEELEACIPGGGQSEDVRVEILEVAPSVEDIAPDDKEAKLIECQAENLKLREELEQEKNKNKGSQNLNEQINQLQASLTTCTNNLNRVRQEYGELEAENTQNKNLANLYKAESDQLKKDKLTLQAELKQCKELWKAAPLTAQQATGALAGAQGVGRNWAEVIKYAREIKRLQNILIQNKLARQVPHGRTVRWIGDNLNYMMDALVRVTRPYIGDKEASYAYSAKTPESRLGQVPDAK